MNDELGCLELRFGAGENFESRAKGTQLQLESEGKEGIVSYVAATGTRFSSGNVQNDPRYRELFSMMASEIAVPIRDRSGRIRGVFNLESDQQNAYTDEARLALMADPSFQDRYEAQYAQELGTINGAGLEGQTVIEVGSNPDLQDL